MGKQRSALTKTGRAVPAGMTDWNKILLAAKEIVESYDTGVTLRQLFYRLVATGNIPNKQQAYKTLSARTAAARREGWFPSLIDRTRAVEVAESWLSALDSMENTAAGYRRDRTEGQKWQIYIGVEKHGLTTQLWHWFSNRGIPVLALGGYSSQTFVDVVANRVNKDGRQSVLLYGGDFDPSGIDIDRDFEERTECFDEIVRVALNEDQVAEYDLPPMPGKHTDARAWSFIQKHGELMQVELDALPPETLKEIYEANIKPYWNKKAYDKVVKQEAEERDVLTKLVELVTLDDMGRITHIIDNDDDGIAEDVLDLLMDQKLGG